MTPQHLILECAIPHGGIPKLFSLFCVTNILIKLTSVTLFVLPVKQVQSNQYGLLCAATTSTQFILYSQYPNTQAELTQPCITIISTGSVPVLCEQCPMPRHLLQLTWRVHEVKVHQVVNAQLLQLQHHRAQVGAQDLRVRVFLHLCRVRFLCVQAEALARPRTTGSTCTLLSASFGNGSDQEGLHPDARVVHLCNNEGVNTVG